MYSLVQLRVLRAGNNMLHGVIPTQIGQLQRLEQLSIGNSQIGGVLPEELFTLGNLSQLNIENATFTGKLSSSFANLKSARIINLSNNEFTGAIPGAFYELEFLGEFIEASTLPILSHKTHDFSSCQTEILALQGNQLTGVIPTDLCDTVGVGFGRLQNLTVDCAVDCDCCDEWTECPRGVP